LLLVESEHFIEQTSRAQRGNCEGGNSHLYRAWVPEAGLMRGCGRLFAMNGLSGISFNRYGHCWLWSVRRRFGSALQRVWLPPSPKHRI